ncbi:MAG: repair protein SbcD/Mre11 [Chloroflexota bacterium]|jgi:DNA repair exonuclease SbcCD nuclease subunit|nr:repair protein SbcD/Mre11 [Chloroflexota bacterium]
MRLLHLADLHLDRAFGGLAFAGCDGTRRRGLLRQALEWAVDAAEAEKAAALTIAGDLFELEHVTADTVAFMTRQFSRLTCPVVITSGNHDPAAAASPYRVAQWPANVVLCLEPRPVTVDLGDAVLIGLGYTGKDMDPSVLDRLPPRGKEKRPRLLMVHGVDLDGISTDFRWGGLGLRAADLDRLGFDHALMGHVHAGHTGERLSWPGSPVPLDPGETAGAHGALWIDVIDGRVTSTELKADIARFETVSVDVTEIADSSELATAVGRVLEPLLGSTALVTCRLWGRHDKSLAIDAPALGARWADSVLGLKVVDATVTEVDLQELAREPTARGAAIGRLLADGSAAALWSAQLVAEAFEGDLRLPA